MEDLSCFDFHPLNAQHMEKDGFLFFQFVISTMTLSIFSLVSKVYTKFSVKLYHRTAYTNYQYRLNKNNRLSPYLRPGVLTGVTSNNKGGNTRSEAIRAKNIIVAVKKPYAANIGIGANAIIEKPRILVTAE